MKKIIAIILALALILGLAACGSENKGGNAQPQNSAQPANQGGSENNATDYYFEKDGVKIVMGAPAKPIIDSLEKYNSSYEAPSCAFDGMDVVYSYPGFDVLTFKQGDGEAKISGLVLRDDTVTTVEGIFIGSDKVAVESSYGKIPEGESSLSIQKGSTQLLIILTDGYVSSIQYYPITK